MKLTLKLDENGNAVLKDGKPAYETDDGKDFVADVNSMYAKTLELKGEAKRNRDKAEAAESQVATYTGVLGEMDEDGLKAFKQAADEALVTVKNLDDKQLLDAGKVEEIKQELKDAHDKNLANVKAKFQAQADEHTQLVSKKDQQIFDLMVGNAFASSKYFSGPKPVTTLPPDAALGLFGRNFKVQEDKATGELQIVATYNGKEILSTEPDQVGELAGPEEAIAYLVERYPHKDRIIPAGPSGSGAGGGQGGNGGEGDDLAKLREQHAEASKSGDGRTAIVLKRKIHALQQQQQGNRA